MEIEVNIINNKVSANFGNGTFKMRFSLSVTPIRIPDVQPWRQLLRGTSRTQMVNKRMLWESKIFHELLPIWEKLVS